MSAGEFHAFSILLRLAWISPRPCMLPPDIAELQHLAEAHVRGPLPARALERFVYDRRVGFLVFPPQLRALQRLVGGEDLYALLWDDRL